MIAQVCLAAESDSCARVNRVPIRASLEDYQELLMRHDPAVDRHVPLDV